jgi:hypothetical protein
MRYKGIIYQTTFTPYVNVVPSPISIRVLLPDAHEIIEIRDEGTIQELSEKYQFKIINESEWDLRPMYKRDCIVEKNGDEFRFVSYGY